MLNKPLLADFKPIVAKPEMSRNESCWCQSGRKWKRCHKDRQSANRLPEAALHAEVYKQAQFTTCLHPSAPASCSFGPIRSHTVQRATALKAISEDGHVLSGRDARPGKPAEFLLERVGINSASTFRGFCSKHDGEAFRDADRATDVTEWIAFLLGYRALSYERYMKDISIPLLEKYRDHLDAGLPFEAQERIQRYIHGNLFTSRLAVIEHERHKSRWDIALQQGKPEGFKWACLTFDGILPIVASGAYYPEYDFAGKRLQTLTSPIGTLNMLTFNVVVIGNNTKIVFGWLDRKAQSSQLIDSFLSLEQEYMASSIIQFFFDTSDNIFVTPSWWESLDRKLKKKLAALLANSTPGDKDPNGLRPLSKELSPIALGEAECH
jgi:hypothetical protein